MKLRFQADNDLRASIRTGVLRQEPTRDFQSAKLARLDGIPHPEVLHLAASQDRILISHNENSMTAHFRDFLADGNHSPGLLLVRQSVPTAAVIESILLFWIASTPEDWKDRIAWLPI